MTQKLVAEIESVRTALEAMRQAEPLGIGHPLTHYLSFRAKRRNPGGPSLGGQAALDGLIFDGMSGLIRHHLNRHRKIYDLPPMHSIEDPLCIDDDFQHGNTELEAWSFLYYRYVRVDLDLSLDARPIPEVDELLSLGMDLWAVEQGFRRIEPGLAGV